MMPSYSSSRISNPTKTDTATADKRAPSVLDFLHVFLGNGSHVIAYHQHRVGLPNITVMVLSVLMGLVRAFLVFECCFGDQRQVFHERMAERVRHLYSHVETISIKTVKSSLVSVFNYLKRMENWRSIWKHVPLELFLIKSVLGDNKLLLRVSCLYWSMTCLAILVIIYAFMRTRHLVEEERKRNALDTVFTLYRHPRRKSPVGVYNDLLVFSSILSEPSLSLAMTSDLRLLMLLCHVFHVTSVYIGVYYYNTVMHNNIILHNAKQYAILAIVIVYFLAPYWIAIKQWSYSTTIKDKWKIEELEF